VTPKTETLVSALRILSVEIQSGDGVANAVVAEAADRLTLMANLVARHIEETKKDTAEMQTACETMNGATETIQRLKSQINRLDEELMDTKNKYAVLVADVVLYEDRGERIKRLEDIIHRASCAFFRDGSDGQVASGMLTILEEGRKP
jgi:DNA integrity scanning protein DisA with diadenylate cyclase activity